MRGLETSVSIIRKKVLKEVALAAYESEDVKQTLEAIPYKISPTDEASYRESVWRERAISSERVRLAMGLSLRPSNLAVHLTSGFEHSNISEKYYEPPLVQVIPSACDHCDNHVFEVSNMCRGCVAHPCIEVCPKDAVHIIHGKAYINQDTCIKCGKCKDICPYDAIAQKERPCSLACGVNAIETDNLGRAIIDHTKCVSCGQCMVSCPFGAIADKSQIYQMIHCIRDGEEVIAEIAPAYIGQFGASVSTSQLFSALKDIGFKSIYEVALGADIGAISEAHHYVNEVMHGELPFLLTSCCPSWSVLAKNQFPETIDSISQELTPMVATARSIKKAHPNCKVVFIGPCAAKKLEASRTSVRSDVDFVITFEELAAIFDAKNIDLTKYENRDIDTNATGAGKGYAISSGVAAAIEKCIHKYYPGIDVNIEHAEGLTECKKILQLAKLGKKDGCLIEGMACPGGCIAGAGTLSPIKKARRAIEETVEETVPAIPPRNLEKISLPCKTNS